jgi:hypothetical protein
MHWALIGFCSSNLTNVSRNTLKNTEPCVRNVEILCRFTFSSSGNCSLFLYSGFAPVTRTVFVFVLKGETGPLSSSVYVSTKDGSHTPDRNPSALKNNSQHTFPTALRLCCYWTKPLSPLLAQDPVFFLFFTSDRTERPTCSSGSQLKGGRIWRPDFGDQ